METFNSLREHSNPSQTGESKTEIEECSRQTQITLPSTIQPLSPEEVAQLENDEAEVTIIGHCEEDQFSSDPGLSVSSPDTPNSLPNLSTDPNQEVVIAMRIDNYQNSYSLITFIGGCKLTVQSLICIAVGISVGIVASFIITYSATGSFNESDMNMTGSNPISGTLDFPSSAPSIVSTVENFVDYTYPKFSPEVNYLINQVILLSDIDLAKTNKTAQGRAFRWIADQDNITNDTIVEKFSLATIYLSTGWAVNNTKNIDTGQKVQLDDFSNRHFCEWKSYSRGKWNGVTKCDNENKIETLDLCK